MVTDPSDAVVPKAHVTLTDNALQRVSEAETDARGLASFASFLGGRAKPANEGRVKTGQRGMHSGH